MRPKGRHRRGSAPMFIICTKSRMGLFLLFDNRKGHTKTLKKLQEYIAFMCSRLDIFTGTSGHPGTPFIGKSGIAAKFKYTRCQYIVSFATALSPIAQPQLSLRKNAQRRRRLAKARKDVGGWAAFRSAWLAPITQPRLDLLEPNCNFGPLYRVSGLGSSVTISPLPIRQRSRGRLCLQDPSHQSVETCWSDRRRAGTRNTRTRKNQILASVQTR